MKVAKREDEIGLAGRGNVALSNAKNSRRDLAVRRLVGLDLAGEGVELVRFSVRRLEGVNDGTMRRNEVLDRLRAGARGIA